ncbi:MAG: hypothetical protein IK094_04085, partial [Treponema sp.]|nr:hypothetical protein [Treponema sp.]
MEIVLIIIAVLISSGIAFALRWADRDNNSMDKVKRYADKRQEDLGKFLDARFQSMRAAAAELETKKDQAVATVKRLAQEMEGYQKIIASVQKDKSAAEQIEQKVNNYGRAITELSEMTAAVEENLKRVKQEGLVVDTVRARIKENADNIDKISKRIPVVVSDFEKVNAQQLRLVGADILKKVDERVADVKSRA